jgi:hypothetical protein
MTPRHQQLDQVASLWKEANEGHAKCRRRSLLSSVISIFDSAIFVYVQLGPPMHGFAIWVAGAFLTMAFLWMLLAAAEGGCATAWDWGRRAYAERLNNWFE